MPRASLFYVWLHPNLSSQIGDLPTAHIASLLVPMKSGDARERRCAWGLWGREDWQPAGKTGSQRDLPPAETGSQRVIPAFSLQLLPDQIS